MIEITYHLPDDIGLVVPPQDGEAVDRYAIEQFFGGVLAAFLLRAGHHDAYIAFTVLNKGRTGEWVTLSATGKVES